MKMAELKTDPLLNDIPNGNEQVVLQGQPTTSSSSDGVSSFEADDANTPHVCYLCGVSFSCRTYVNRHIKNVHAEISKEHNKCPKCPMTFQKYESFWEHVVRVHENPGVQGQPLLQPGRKFDESEVPLVVPETEAEIEALVESLVSSEDDKTCLRCQKRLCDKKNVKRHIREVHLRLNEQKSKRCEECGKTFVNNSVYQAHVRNIHKNPVPTMKCPKCSGKRFKEVKGLRRHLRDVHHSEEDEVNKLAPISTEKRKATTVTVTSEQKNITITSQVGPDEDVVYTCTTCEISFVTQEASLRHNKNAHGMAVETPPPSRSRPGNLSSSSSKKSLAAGGPKEYRCTKCGKCFSTRNNLRGHSVVHQKASLERPMKNMLRTIFGQLFSSTSLTCRICQEVVSTSVEGRLHVYIKHPEKYEELVTRPAQQANGLLQCETCEEKMGSQEEMIGHIERCHPDVYIPTCSQCGLKELKERDMNLHFKKYHPEISRHVCEFCKCGFSQRRELMYHYTREHRGDTVQCPYCPEKHVKVKLHVTVKHPEKAEEYGEMKRKEIREEQLSRARFNKFLEKGVMDGKVGRAKYKRREKDGGEEEEREDAEVEEEEGENELEDRKPNICFVKETEKVVIPEQYKIKKNESTPHLIEVQRLPPPPTPSSLPPQPLLEEEETLQKEVRNEDASELDIKPDVNELEKCINENSKEMREKTVAVRVKRLTEEEIEKWTKRTDEIEAASANFYIDEVKDDDERDMDNICGVTGKAEPLTLKRGRKRKKRRR